MLENLRQKIPVNSKLLNIIFGVLITIPVVAYIFKFSILYRHGIFRGEDWDYFAQAYEAARVSIIHYHQFPWWNPWANGGQPLFANPQFGLFSIQMPLVLLFGTVVGLHFAMFAYFIIGFWGMYLLLKRIGAQSKLLAVLLSYIWVFSGFNAWHLAGGHFTFAVYLLSPWAFLAMLNVHRRHGWIWFGLVASLLLQTALHYLTFEALAICAIIAVFQVVRKYYALHLRNIKNILPILRPYLYAGLIIMILCGFRIVYTLQFTHEFPRLEPLDPAESINLLIASLTFRHPADPGALTTLGITHYGWIEYADYFGLITLVLFCYLLLRRFEKIRTIIVKEWVILGATLLALLISLGAFASFSPFSLLHGLPVFNQMRVPSRFICWFALGVILFLTRLPRKRFIYALLIVSAIDVFVTGYPILNYGQSRYIPPSHSAVQFQQYEFFQTNPSLGQMNILELQNFRLLRTTQSNYGEVYGYEPILNVAEYYYLPGPGRCGVNHGCNFVLTNNATVTYWSPLKISLKRTGPGVIKLNMNPGKVWQVNGTAPFKNYKILDLQKLFTITTSAKLIDVTYSPVL